MKKLVSLAVLTALVAGCADLSQTGGSDYGSDGIGEETLATEAKTTPAPVNDDSYLLAAAPRYYVGNAYKVEDTQYIPAEDWTYNQVGMAGIIPTELNGTKTSNGETYNMNQMLGTSKTLPLPTIAKVTNLENGESVVVRINNRGPFVNTRIIDLSAAAAEKIGITNQSKVQVQIMPEQTMLVKTATVGKTAMVPATETVAKQQVVAEPVKTSEPAPASAPAPVASGDYSVQVAAFYAEDSANTLLQKMRNYGDAIIVKEGDMYKVRIVNLDAAGARRVIDALRNGEGMAPGLLKNGRWINADSI
ncbi:MAG: septal ring lytic transglycosylase RlpA family protein [Alphaproteobacteria bacterium]|nr:septal ring lytic transglycosylase RlpA family protein [Alphaproteobacteria bacterium]